MPTVGCIARDLLSLIMLHSDAAPGDVIDALAKHHNTFKRTAEAIKHTEQHHEHHEHHSATAAASSASSTVSHATLEDEVFHDKDDKVSGKSKKGKSKGQSPALVIREALIEDFSDICFAFGIELDSATTEKEMASQGEFAASGVLSTDLVFKVEVAANRYDMLSVEGIAMALRCHLGFQEPPAYKLTPSTLEMHVQKPIIGLRSFVCCGVLRNITFTLASYKSFIDMQDKLHQTIGKRRQLVSIGTHDLDTIKGPFTYTAKKPTDISFIPLKKTEKMNAAQLMEVLSKDLKLKEYLDIIRDKPEYPVITDSTGVVLSLPPIINGEHSKISLNTKNVLIEVTATDLTKAIIVLETVLTNFSRYCATPFTFEKVTIISPEGNKVDYPPPFETRIQTASVKDINVALGLNLKKEDICQRLKKMSLIPLNDQGDADTVVVNVTPTRSDILHQCDIIEDVAISHGFNNIIANSKCTSTVGKQLVKTKISELISQEVAMAGYVEVMTWVLCSVSDNFDRLRRPNDGSAVLIGNSKSDKVETKDAEKEEKFQTARTTLLSGLLKCVSNNKTVQRPIKVFEVGDVVLKDATQPVGARNHHRIAALYCGTTSGFEYIHGLLDRIMAVCNVVHQSTAAANPGKPVYYLQASDSPSFFPHHATVFVEGIAVGSVGTVHPEVLKAFDIDSPCSALELELDFKKGL
eukprot:TRINITY_DN5047_c0_g1_i1.p1 TRINITY_DN5047_c0_g1~~TRINITY_DN5047_c0_g1_i1.p1  ORF type:complete len:694 (+),score=228.16 TRINITY_DN5047_c0_g1_i1:26-2107(+)